MPCSLVNASEESAALIFFCHAIWVCNFFQNVLAVRQTIWPHSRENYHLQTRLWEHHACFVSYFTRSIILCHITTEPFHWHWKCVIHSTKMYRVISRYYYRFMYLIIWNLLFCTFDVQFIFLLFQTLIMADTEFLSFPDQNPCLPSKTVKGNLLIPEFFNTFYLTNVSISIMVV